MIVAVTAVVPEPGATVWTGLGTAEDGSVIQFAGDWRPMRELQGAVEEQGSGVIEVDLEPWQVLGTYSQPTPADMDGTFASGDARND